MRTYPFKDNQFITKIFTKEDGIISCIIRKKKFQAILSQLLTIVTVTYKTASSTSFVYLQEAHVDHVYKTLTMNSHKIQCAIVLCEILNKCLTEKNPEAYPFIINAFKHFDFAKQFYCGFDSLFLIKFCEIMGISPLYGNINNLHSPRLSIKDGVFGDYDASMHNNNYIPVRESAEIYHLSKLTFHELEQRPISQHLANLDNLKSLKIIKELV